MYAGVHVIIMTIGGGGTCLVVTDSCAIWEISTLVDAPKAERKCPRAH